MPQLWLLIDAAVLWMHLLTATFFVGGAFFMWLIVIPASYLISSDESEGTQLVGKSAKVFGKAEFIYRCESFLPSVRGRVASDISILS